MCVLTLIGWKMRIWRHIWTLIGCLLISQWISVTLLTRIHSSRKWRASERRSCRRWEGLLHGKEESRGEEVRGEDRRVEGRRGEDGIRGKERRGGESRLCSTTSFSELVPVSPDVAADGSSGNFCVRILGTDTCRSCWFSYKLSSLYTHLFFTLSSCFSSRFCCPFLLHVKY